MTAKKPSPATIDEYIAGCPVEVQPVLQKVRTTIRKAAPDATEIISYQIPAFRLNNANLVYFAAWKKHIGFYPPVNDEALKPLVAPYAGEKGNLQFPLDERIPYALITKIVKSRVKQTAQKQAAKKPRSKSR